MDFWFSFTAALVLLLTAAGLMALHMGTWRAMQGLKPKLKPKEEDFRRRQYRRRMQTSAMVGLVGLAILGGEWIDRPVSVAIAYWAAVLLLVMWIMLLALADIIATRLFFNRLTQHVALEKVKMQVELNRQRRSGGNGKPSGNGSLPPTDGPQHSDGPEPQKDE